MIFVEFARGKYGAHEADALTKGSGEGMEDVDGRNEPL